MLVLVLIAVLWTGMHNAPDNAPVRQDASGHLIVNRDR